VSARKTTRERFFVGGEWVAPRAGSPPTQVFNAADGGVLGTVPLGDEGDGDAAVAAARSAFKEWSQTPPWIRANYLKAIREYLATRQEEIAELIALEVGTPLRVAQRVQAGLPLATLDGFIEISQRMAWEEQIAHSTVRREPVGVVVAITPWNYPLHQLVGKVGGALAAGCTVVAKPADIAPLSSFCLAEACEAVGLPPGVFNLVSGPGPGLGERLASHPDVDMVSFTGSTRVGMRIAELAARNITRLSLELGGKSASVVLEDADFARAVRTSVGNCFLNSGQTCSAWTRLIVPRNRQDEVIELARITAQALTVGHPLHPDTKLGPLASDVQQTNVQRIVAEARARRRPRRLGGFYPRRLWRLLRRAYHFCRRRPEQYACTGGGVRARPCDHPA